MLTSESSTNRVSCCWPVNGYFAGHRDSVSELVGDVLEGAIEGVLIASGISFRKTRRAERVTGFDQAPDFIIPDETWLTDALRFSLQNHLTQL